MATSKPYCANKCLNLTYAMLGYFPFMATSSGCLLASDLDCAGMID
jgi:hypothetical protein